MLSNESIRYMSLEIYCMRWQIRAASAVAVVIVSLESSVAADDRLFIRLPTEVASARSIGLGGATVALGGETSGLASNPASLVAVSRSLDVTVAAGTRGACTIGLAIHPLATAAGGLILPCPWKDRPAADVRVPLVAASDGTESLRPKDGRWFGLAGAWMPDHRVALGGLVQVDTLRLLGDNGQSRRDSWINWSLGAFVQPDWADGTRVGVAFRHGTNRTFAGDDAGTLDDPGISRSVRRPDILSFGVAWRYAWLKNTRIVVSIQPELVRYPKVLSGATGNELDLRTGAEAWFPFGHCVSGCGGMWQLRAGLISRSAIPASLPLRTSGRDPSKRTTSWTAGFSLAPELGGGKFKLDLAYSDESETFVCGIAYRFPNAFRGDLEHHRSRP
ncbi:MAG TPA: hypothetical protein VIK51_23445 [Vicinamibacteria bacterium]